MKLSKRLLLVAIFATSLTLYAQEAEPREGGDHAAESEEEAEDPMLQTWKWANFALLAIGMGIMLGKMLPKAFAARTEAIQKDIKESARLKADAEKRAAEVEAKVASLGADIEKFKTESAKEMAQEGERIRQETAAQIQRIEAQSSLEIENAGKIARRELRQYASELALKMAEERVRSRMDASSETALVDGFVAELSQQRATARESQN